MTYDEFIEKAEYRKSFEVSATSKELFDFAIQMAEGLKEANHEIGFATCVTNNYWNDEYCTFWEGFANCINCIENNIEELNKRKGEV